MRVNWRCSGRSRRPDRSALPAAGDQFVYEPGNRNHRIRLPQSGLGTGLADLTDAGNWAGRPSQDNSAMINRHRKPAQDAAMASARRERQEGGFLSRLRRRKIDLQSGYLAT